MRAAVLLGLLVPLLAGCAQPPLPRGGDQGVVEAAIVAEVERAGPLLGQLAFQYTREQLRRDVPCPPPPPGEPHGDFCFQLDRTRVTGSAGSNATAEWIAERLRAAGANAAFDPFMATFEGRALPARNVVGTRAGGTDRVLFLGAHYDTRPCADKDPDPARRAEPVLGANDGGSGVGVLLALAEVLRDRALNLTLRFVFFDAEDMGDGGRGCGRGTAWAQGSAHYARGLGAAERQRASGMVLVDMVGDAALEVRREQHSAQAPHRALQDDLWTWAAELGHEQFKDLAGTGVLDDHLAFQQAGIPAVDIIHLDGGADPFPDSHHTTFDDLEHVRAESLQAAGETLLAALLGWDAAEGARARG